MPESKARAILEVQVTGVNQGNNAVKGFQENVTRSMTASEKSVASAIGGMIAQYASLAVAVQKAAKVMSSGIEFNKFVENQTMSFGIMMKSMSAAKTQMQDLYNFAVNSPLTFKETAGSAKQLMAYGFAAKELVPTMETLGSVAIATGNRLDDIAYVYGTLRSQGRAYSRDLMQFGMRGIPIYEELAKVMGVGSDQIQKMASQGKIGFKEVEKAFKNMTSAGGRFGGILDAYMDTLTGKMSMLGDIAEQTAGKLMEPTTKVLKDTVEDLTKQFQGAGFQSYVKDLSQDIGLIAQALANVLKIIITMLPVITTFVKLWITFKGLQLAKEVLGKLPGLLLKVGDALVSGGVAINGFAAAGASMAATLNTAFASATTGLKLFMAELVTFIAANPWILALVGVTAAAGIAIGGMIKEHERNKASANPNVRANELMNEYATKAYSATAGGSTAILQAEDVKKIAEEYQLAEGTTARILINSGALEESSWKQYMNTKSSVMALEEYKKVQEGLKHTSLTMEEEQARYFAGITGFSPEHYYDPNDTAALGRRAANDYIASLQATTQQQKDLLGSALMPDDTKNLLAEELKNVTAKLQDTLSSGLDMGGLEKSGYLQGLRDYIKKLTEDIDGLGNKTKELKYIDLGKWWMPLEYAVKRTASQMDDIDLATRKARENAAKEYNSRMEAYRVDLLITADAEERAELIQRRNKDTSDYYKLLVNITNEGKKQRNISRFSELTGQSNALFENFQAKAGEAFQGAVDATSLSGFIKNMASGIANAMGSAMQGTEVGDMASGFMQGGVVGLIATIAAKFISLLSSIENVGKAFNAITTMWESMKKVVNLEGLFNNAFKPVVQHLEQLGAAIGKFMPIIIGLVKVANALFYITLVMVLVPLQALGNAFMWVYDHAIVPFGNAVVGFINAIIRVINTILGWAGVNIQYLDALETSTEAVKDFAKIIENMKSSLDQTIDYLTKKINDAVDKQLSSLQDLYEVGAITATDYEKRAKDLNAQKINTDDVLVSAMDKAITSTAEMYNRLYELYDLKDILENTEGLTEEQQAKLLKDAGLSDANLETTMKNAVLAALTAYGASRDGSDIDASGMTYQNKIDAAKKAVEDAKAQVQRYSAAIQNDQNLINRSLGFNFGAISDKASHRAELEKWARAYAEAQATLTALQSSGMATGTPNVPQDMLTTVHKNEGIIPATFMDGIRSGELSLSGGNNRGSTETPINVNVYVSGSVTSENNLADTVAETIYKRRKQGLLTV